MIILCEGNIYSPSLHISPIAETLEKEVSMLTSGPSFILPLSTACPEKDTFQSRYPLRGFTGLALPRQREMSAV